MSTTFKIPDTLIQLMKQNPRVTVLAGAGISTESGIPTFRESLKNGWAPYKPGDLSSIRAFEKNPTLVWSWYKFRKEIIDRAIPSKSHIALAKLEENISQFTLIAQNADGLNQKAGIHNVIEIHGNVHRARCIPEEKIVPVWDANQIIPKCPTCGGFLRPDVVFFGEPIPNEELAMALKASRNCDVFFSIGTSGIIEPAATLAYEALRNGAKVVEINPAPTPLTVFASFYFAQKAEEVLPGIIEQCF